MNRHKIFGCLRTARNRPEQVEKNVGKKLCRRGSGVPRSQRQQLDDMIQSELECDAVESIDWRGPLRPSGRRVSRSGAPIQQTSPLSPREKNDRVTAVRRIDRTLRWSKPAARLGPTNHFLCKPVRIGRLRIPSNKCKLLSSPNKSSGTGSLL